MNNNNRGSNVVYQSLSYTMIKELLDNSNTPAWIKIWLYFSILQKYGKRIYAKNKYISEKLNIPLGTVKYSITKLRDEGLIIIENSGSWLRKIKLTKVASIDESDNKEISNNNEKEYHSIYGRKLFKNNVYLTDDEYNSICDILENDSKAIEQYLNGMDKYLSEAVIKYKSHYQMLCIWIQNDVKQKENKKKKYDTPDYKWFYEIERGYLKDKKENKIDPNELKEIFDYDWLNDSEDDD